MSLGMVSMPFGNTTRTMLIQLMVDIRSRQEAKHIRTNTYPGCTSTNSPGSPYLWPHIFDSASNGTGVGEISDDWLFSWDMQQESVTLSTPAFASTPPALSSSLSSSVFGSPLTPCGEKDTKPRLDFDFLNFGDQSISCNLEATLALPDQGAFPPTSSSWDTFNEVLDTMNARPAGVKPDAPTYIPQPPTSPSPGQQKDFNVKMKTDTSSRSRSRSRSSSIFSSSSSTPSISLQDGGRQDKQSGDAATTMVLENVGQELMSEILLVVFRSKEQPKLKLYNQ